MDLLARVAALEAAVFGKPEAAPVPVSGAESAPALYGEVPVSLVAVGFSRDRYVLRPERYPGEPVAERLVARGDIVPTTYTYDPTLPPDVRVARWESMGSPSRDSLGRELDTRGAPVGEQRFSPAG